MKNKINIVIVISIILVITFLVINFISIKDDFNNSLFDFNINFRLVNTEIKRFDQTVDNIHTFKNNNLELIFTDRVLSNNDHIYFFEFENKSFFNRNVTLKIKYGDIINKKHEFDYLNIKRDFSNSVGYDKITNPAMYIETNKRSYLISKDYNYKQLENTYEGNGLSLIKELIKENSNIKINDGFIEKEISIAPFSKVDSFIVYSDSKLLNDDNAIKIYEKMLVNSQTAVWQTPHGRIIKIFYSIDPFTREGYAINLANIFEKSAFKTDDQSRLFNNLVESSVMSIIEYIPKNSDKLFLTEYTSTWVMKPYGIFAPYIDTRHNENLGYSLRNYGASINNDFLKYYHLNYSDFLVRKYQEKDYFETSYGILFYDYYSDFGKYQTHASLNHQLAIVNYLFNSYIDTNNDKYYNLANTLLKTITNIGDKWIRDNGDLWYEIKLDETFEGNDYLDVTLEDLIYTQELLYKINGKIDVIILKLIDSKINYLKNNNYEISDYILNKYNKIKKW